jgi:hypothetical protein
MIEWNLVTPHPAIVHMCVYEVDDMMNVYK